MSDTAIRTCFTYLFALVLLLLGACVTPMSDYEIGIKAGMTPEQAARFAGNMQPFTDAQNAEQRARFAAEQDALAQERAADAAALEQRVQAAANEPLPQMPMHDTYTPPKPTVAAKAPTSTMAPDPLASPAQTGDTTGCPQCSIPVPTLPAPGTPGGPGGPGGPGSPGAPLPMPGR